VVGQGFKPWGAWRPSCSIQPCARGSQYLSSLQVANRDVHSTWYVATTQTQFFCVHDPAWWWVKASNLGGPGGPVVRFNLAHVVHSTSPHCRWRIGMFTALGMLQQPKHSSFVCMILPGGGSRLQTLGGLAAQLFDSTLRTWFTVPLLIAGSE
jgi:hypothetical protein